MKIKIITIHCIHNFGSVFQSYGLVKYLRNHGFDAEIIDYRPEYYKKGRNAIKRFLGIMLNYFSYCKQRKKYQTFINIYLPKGKLYKSLHELRSIQTDDTIFIAGGDQIWNTFHACGRDDAYKLTFVKDCKKIAYGTSMGRNTFTEEELNELSDKISDFFSIGLREQSTVTMLQPYLKIPVYHAADPVLLLDVCEYMQFIGEKRIIQEPYLVMYLAAKSDLLSKTVEYIAKKRGLKIVHVCGFKKKCKCDYFLKDIGPSELLNLIYYSEFTVSASFHATLFSIIFHKNFCTLLPEAGTNTRIEDLLAYFQLSNRIIRDEKDLLITDNQINYSVIENKKIQFVDRSQKELLKAIKG